MFITDNTKFEDIRQSLYIVGCGLDYVAREGIRPRGMKQPGKLVTGFGSFLLILVLMFLPFFFFSFSQQASEGKAVLMVSAAPSLRSHRNPREKAAYYRCGHCRAFLVPAPCRREESPTNHKDTKQEAPLLHTHTHTVLLGW